MITKFKKNLNDKRYGIKGLIAVGLPFLVVGILMASGLNWTRPSVAGNLTAGPQVSVPSKTVMPSSFSELAGNLSPTVVNVKVTKVEKAVFHGSQIPEGHFGDFFERFFKEMPQMPENHRTQGAGSGVIITADGMILTNNHVVEDAKEVTVTLSNKEEYKAQVVGRDPKTDLAVLKIEAKEALPAAAMGNSEQLKVGDWVIAIGNPFGLSHTVTSGIVSAKGRVIGAGPYDDFIQTDASINPGNSGGPLFNMSGEVVGINTAIIPQGQGIGFAIPVNMAKLIIPQLRDEGHVTRGWLGVAVQSLNKELADSFGLKSTHGALVNEVTKDSPAERAGLQRGDIILNYDGQQVDELNDLPRLVAATPVNKTVEMSIYRDGKERTVKVVIGKLDEGAQKAPTREVEKGGVLGISVADLTPDLIERYHLEGQEGILVINIDPDGPAADANLGVGDLILEADGRSITNVKAFSEVVGKLSPGKVLRLLIQRRATLLYTTVTLK